MVSRLGVVMLHSPEDTARAPKQSQSSLQRQGQAPAGLVRPASPNLQEMREALAQWTRSQARSEQVEGHRRPGWSSVSPPSHGVCPVPQSKTRERGERPKPDSDNIGFCSVLFTV